MSYRPARCRSFEIGPTGWPILGYLPYLDLANPHAKMKHLIDKYGPIFRLKFGSWQAIVVSDYELIRKAFHRQDMSFRPKIYLFELTGHGNHGLGASSGPLWHEQRRFALRHLRDLGLGKSIMERHIQEEALYMMGLFRQSNGQPMDLSLSLNIAITNVVWAMVAG